MKVTIERHGSGLRLAWICPVKGKRVRVNAPNGRIEAESKQELIEEDLKRLGLGYYDPTLLKYKSRTSGKNPTEITTVELFDKFTQHQLKHKRFSNSHYGK